MRKIGWIITVGQWSAVAEIETQQSENRESF